MNKLYLTLVFILLFSFLKAQVFFGGLKGGLVASQVSGDMISGFNKAGITGGGFAGFDIKEKSYIQMEMLFVQKGSRQNPNYEKGIYNSYLLRLNYIELPIVYVWKGISFLEIETGFSYAYLIKNENVEWTEIGLLSGSRPFNKNEISFQLGMNYIVSDNIKVNFRSNNSILRIRKHAGGATYLLNRGQYNTCLMLGLIYIIR